MMLTDNNQIFRNWFVIIHRYFTKVSAQIIQRTIFYLNELYNTIYSMIGCFVTVALVAGCCGHGVPLTEVIANYNNDGILMTTPN